MKKCKFLLVLLTFLSLFTLSSLSFAGGVEAPKPWQIYIGALGGYYNADFGYNATYFSTAARTEYVNNDAFQQGYTIGGQIGVEYHLHSPYFFGLVFAAMDDENKARLASNDFDNGVVISSLSNGQVGHLFRINYSLDIAVLFGIDITPFTQAYAKIGASCANFADHFFTTRNRSFPFPTPFSQYTQRLDLWGWIFGLGLRHDINRWINMFVEYDYYAYGNQSLIDFNNFDTTATIPDSLTQNVRINANAVVAGLNLKFMDSFHGIPQVQQTGAWMVYAGLLAGYYTADFGYGANYFSNAAGAANQTIQNDVFQGGFSGGVQLGLQYHFRQPYFTGFTIGWMDNANKARLSNTMNSNAVPTFNAMDISNTFRLNYNLDLAWIIGADITRWFHLYAKAGASYAQLRQEFFVTGSRGLPFPTIFFLQNTHNNIWGFLLGFGLSHDVTKWLNVFAEYDHYFYPTQNLNSYDNIFPFFNPAAGPRDHLTQHVNVDASAIHFGVNFKLMDPYFVSMRQMVRARPWMFYIGGFGGYYSANFIYGANYFTNSSAGGAPGNQTTNNNTFQKGISGGGQVGIHYHFRRPYFVGLTFTGASNGSKARLSVTIENAIASSGVNQTINYNFKNSSNWDIAAIWGMDITPQTHLYAKLGASCARFSQRFTIIATNTLPFTLQQVNRESIWGWVFGAGISHDLGRYVSIFAEGDHYAYSNRNLGALSNISPFPTPAATLLTQHIQIYANTVRLGLNLTFQV